MRILYIIALLFSSLNVFAQYGTINGIVVNNLTNEPIPFANVYIANTTIGTTTDNSGHFTLSSINEEFIQIGVSVLGYKAYISEVIIVSKVKITSVEFRLQPTTEELNEVKVQAKPFQKKPESPVSMQSIGIDLIEKSAGANRDISKVLQSFPGVGNPLSFRNDLIVRGGGPSENRFYLDGIEIPTLNHFSTQGSSGGPIGILNVDFIRKVDFYSGAFPASRGNSLSSVFEFQQKDGDLDQTSFKASVGASELSLSMNGHIGDKTTYIAGARRSYLQFLFDQLGLPFLPTFNDFSFKTRTKINPHNEIIFLGVGAIDQFKLNTATEKTEENEYILSYIPTNNQWNYTFGSVYKHYFSSGYLTLILSRSHLNNSSYKYKDNIEDPENLTYDYKSNEIENKFRVEYTTRPNNFSINIGSNLEYAQYDNNTFTKQFYDGISFEQDYNSELNVFKWGVFGNISHPFINDQLTASLGVRADANNYSSQMDQIIDQISPRLSLSYELTNKLNISGSIGRYFQQPAYTTMGYKESNTFINKNNRLKYIQSTHYIAGVQYNPNEYTKVSVEAFLKNYDNYPFSVNDSISLASKGSDYGVFGDEEVTSTSSGKTRGFEVLVQRKSPNHLNYILSYTYVRSEFTDINNNLIPSSWDSKHLFTSTINKQFRKNWELGIKWRYIGGLPYTPVDSDKSSYVEAWDSRGREYLDYSKFNTERLDPFHQLDLRVDKTYNFKNWSLCLYLDVQNLYNNTSKNPERLTLSKDSNGDAIIINPTDPVEDQRYQLKTLQTSSGTVLPSIGVIIEF